MKQIPPLASYFLFNGKRLRVGLFFRRLISSLGFIFRYVLEPYHCSKQEIYFWQGAHVGVIASIVMSQRVVVVTATITCNGATLRLLSLNHCMRSKIPTTSFTVFFRFRFHMQTIFVQHGTNFFALLKSFSNPKPIMPYSAYQYSL